MTARTQPDGARSRAHGQTHGQVRGARTRLTRERMLDTAEELFGRHGYRETNLREVADRCEISVGALYLHFQNKEDLLRGVIDRRAIVLMARIRSFVEAPGQGLDLLIELTRAEVEFYRTYADFGRLIGRLFSDGCPVMPQLGDDIAHGYAAAMQLEAELIRRGQRDGTIRSGNADWLARLLAAMVGAYRGAEATRADGEPGLPDIQFLQMVRQAFAPAPPG
ncbi:TetR/AcrR family transcriptional regulator [Frankia sp. Mgl5]|uniref:TetR/AcrR family transcriptional regulator n=1 Tax=Frankia sp. Mgl5 TaxID=2933793 RepID=UPI0020106640|nr:TetR/AcrR family transcriptional regulator [Frankia sp. Mgl5]MCK9926313.1 TetR/AcrR family transcriptional regulator [Frankia sp. Mgl5]